VSLIVVALAACGGASPGSQASHVLKGIEQVAVGSHPTFDGFPAWEAVSLRALRLRSIKLPPTNATAGTATGIGQAELLISPSSDAGTGQRVIPPSGVTVTVPAQVSATISESAALHGAWVVSGDVQETLNLPPLPASVAQDPAIARTAIAAIDALFTFEGDRPAYARAQLSFYANATAAGVQSGACPPTLTTVPIPGAGPDYGPKPDAFIGHADILDVLEDADQSFVPPNAATPVRMSASGARMTGAQVVAKVFPTIQVKGTVIVSADVSLRAGGQQPRNSRVRGAVPWQATLVRSPTSGRWFVGDMSIFAQNGYEKVVCSGLNFTLSG